jgi:hypothetical protein
MMTRALIFMFSIALVAFLAFFATGWHALTLGPDNPMPWPIQSVWGDMISVGQGFEAMVGYVPESGRDSLHWVAVVGSASTAWALATTAVIAAAMKLKGLFRKI